METRLKTAKRIAERPITQHGVDSFSPETKGTQRTVQDRMYYLNILKHRISLVSSEIGRLEKQAETLESGNFSQLESIRDKLKTEIQSLQDEFSNLDILVDSLLKYTDISGLEADINSISKETERSNKQLEYVFNERKKKELEIRDENQKFESILEKFKQKTPNLTQEWKKYSRNEQTIKDLNEKVAKLQNERETLQIKLLQVPKAFEQVEKLQLKQEIKELNRKLQEADTFSSEKNRILAEIKSDMQAIRSLEIEIEEFSESKPASYKKIHKLEPEKLEKYLEVIRKTSEIKAFLQNADSTIHSFKDNSQEIQAELERKRADVEKLGQLKLKVETEYATVLDRKQELTSSNSEIPKKPIDQLQHELMILTAHRDSLNAKLVETEQQLLSAVESSSSIEGFQEFYRLEQQVEKQNELNASMQKEIDLLKSKVDINSKSCQVQRLADQVNLEIIKRMQK